jgi:hypothetical protein
MKYLFRFFLVLVIGLITSPIWFFYTLYRMGVVISDNQIAFLTKDDDKGYKE